MGVHGLWKLIEPAGKPVPLESLENKVLAVDVSIWLYQLTKGLQTTGGSAVPNAHLLGLFNRICKLLYYRIKPVFVFDGGVPLLKKETIEARKRQKRKAQDNSEQLREKLLNNLLKQRAVNEFLGNDEVPSSSQIFDDMFVLPPLPEENIDDPDSESDTEITTAKIESFCDFQYGKDLHSIDIKSEQFKSLPAEIRHEILSELIETKKQNSWAKIHEMPERSQDFSKFQLERLKKRRDVQVSLDSAAKEMGGRSLTLNELEAMFQEDGIVTDNLRGQRIVGDNVTRFVYITGKSKEKKSPEKSESVNENEQKTKEKKEVTKVEETSINVKKHEEISIRKKSYISDAEFQKNIQTIEDCVFVKDFSSDEEFDAMDETHDSEYIRTLLDKEKISQDEIFNIIKQEQNLSNNSSLSIVESDIDDKIDSCVEAVPNTCPDDDIIQPTQTYEQSKSKLFLLINQSNKSIVENDDTCGSCNVESKSLLDENEPSQSRSVELFPDDDFEPEGNFVDYLEQKNHSDELPQTVMLPKRDCVSVQNEHISEPKSVELFSDSDSDDFIEVSNDEQSSYFKKFNKEIEISINPNDITQNDIFSDVFNPGSLDDTVILDKNESNQFVSPLLPEPSKPSLGVSNSSNKESNENKFVENIASEKSLENSETKPAKLANIFDKIKKAENIMKKNVSEGKTNSSTESESPRKKELLKEVQEMLNNEQNELSNERAKQERFGSSITQQMIIEAQELLQLFGLPYVVAPMEAEAQCAFLDKISLTEGTITDDSDIWLFGGQKVYKNFFDHRKYVLQFRAIDIEHFFKLSREQLIQMALLVGSDYTVGIEGVGPVTALEILAYFSDVNNKPTSKSDIAETLKKFRLWLKSNRSSSSPLSKKCKNVNLSEAFPSTTVIEAYLFPTVDESKESFTWATPDLDQIRSYMRSKFGWKSTRIDDILLPVMKRLNDTNKQTTLDQFFKSKPFSAIEFGGVSKRVIQAINVMKSKTEEEPLQTPSTSKSPAKKVTKNTVKRTRRSSKKTPLKRTPTALPVYKSSQGMKKVAAPYFGEVIPQKEKDKMDAAKRKLDAIKVFQAQNKNKKKARKNKVLPAKPDSSYLSESSSDDNN